MLFVYGLSDNASDSDFLNLGYALNVLYVITIIIGLLRIGYYAYQKFKHMKYNMKFGIDNGEVVKIGPTPLPTTDRYDAPSNAHLWSYMSLIFYIIFFIYQSRKVRISIIILSLLVTFSFSISFHHLEKQTVILFIFFTWDVVQFRFLLWVALFADDVSWGLIHKELHSLLIHKDFVGRWNCSCSFFPLLFCNWLLYRLLMFLGFIICLFLYFALPFSRQ